MDRGTRRWGTGSRLGLFIGGSLIAIALIGAVLFVARAAT
jgi:hypothetical protein